MKRIMTAFFILFLLPSVSHSRDIEIPEETITDDALKVEKTRIFITPASPGEILFPDLPQMPVGSPSPENGGDGYVEAKTGTDEKAVPDEKAQRFFSIGAYGRRGGQARFSGVASGGRTGFDIDAILDGGYRKNDRKREAGVDYFFENGKHRFKAGARFGSLQLPGPSYGPLGIERDHFSIETGYTARWNQVFSSFFNQSFYSVEANEVNFLSAGVSFDMKGFLVTAGLDRQDVFEDGFSKMSFHQGLYRKGEKYMVGGSVKKIEGEGTRFLPSLEFVPAKGFLASVSAFYRVPDLWKKLSEENYTEMENYRLDPEEEYTAALSFSRESEAWGVRMEVARIFVERGYGWADADKNGLLEPFGQEYSTTSLSLDMRRRLAGNLSIFLSGKRNFYDRDVVYHSGAECDAGFLWNGGRVSLKAWVSYTGSRFFPGERLDSFTACNAEIVIGGGPEWTFGVYDIGDTERMVVPGYPAEGRRFCALAKFGF